MEEKDIKIIEENIDNIYVMCGFSITNALERILNDYKKLLQEYKQDKKVIDKMAEYLADIDFDDCCAEIPHICLGCDFEDYEPHKSCIIDYFRKRCG